MSLDVPEAEVRSRGGEPEDEQVFGLVVADRATMTPHHFVELIGPGIYQDGPLSVVALLDDGTVLLHVEIVGPGGDRHRIVAWQPEEGTLYVESSIASGKGLGAFVFAQQLLRSSSP